MFYGSRKRALWPRGLCPRGLTFSPAYNVEPVTNTSSSSCANNGWQTPRCARRSLPSVAALFFTVCDSYSWEHCRLVCSEARYSSRIAFFAYPTCIRRPRYRGSRRNSATPFGMEKLEWCPMVKRCRRYLYSFWRNSQTWQTDTQTHRHRMTA